mmetsp:Transcript_7474/g.28091  ORF Transcript_7474/g.28091 Transcript_7474/m.28091 type:complete len:279 (+) Transcript_7474:302-1138(+)
MRGICFRKCAMSLACVTHARTLFTNSFTLRSHDRRGTSSRSFFKSLCSFSKISSPNWLLSVRTGSVLKLPTYTLHTSGVMNTFPKLHISAPYTRSSCCELTPSALFNTTRTLSSCPRKLEMTVLNSSEISSLYGSNSRRITSERAANHSQTCSKLYPRLMRCFSPESTPGVSMIEISFNNGASHCEASNFDRNELPNAVSPVKGLSVCTARVCPGVVLFSGPCITTTNRSVVGSGPMCEPGYSRPSKCLINVVFPVLYCPNNSTVGFPSKSPSVSNGE